MMIMKSKKWSRNYHELESEVKRVVHNFSHEQRIPFGFIDDSKLISECIEGLASRVATLSEIVKLDPEVKIKGVKS